MTKYITLFICLLILSCKDDKASKENSGIVDKTAVDNTEVETLNGLTDITTKDFTEFKVLDSENLTKAEIWEAINPQMEDFTEEDYNRLKSSILELNISTLQKHRKAKKFNYEELTKFYLYRIRKFDRENALALNSVIAINPYCIEEAKAMDAAYVNKKWKHPIYGMPVLLKDNINAANMPTTAGSIALKNNNTKDAFVTNQLKSKGALILGKANLSEWAYFFCGDCPSGYSAIGGQTLNPYGKRIFDTGGSSSGSGVSVTVNFCAAAIGSETAGSILSPASQNSVVGLKPTVGLVSRSGVIPISSTLDTAGPITRTVEDNAIVLDAIYGYDKADSKSINPQWTPSYLTENLTSNGLIGIRLGAPKRLLKDTLYTQALKVLKGKGAEIVEIEEEEIGLPNFIRLLNIDMKKDLPVYLENYASNKITYKDVNDIMDFNKQDSMLTMPYGQKLFEGISSDRGDSEYLKRIKDTLKTNGRMYFDKPMTKHKLDGFLSINNYHAAFAAVAEYPALTVPMGYTAEGEPKGLTFIARSFQEKQLLQWGYAYEQASKKRIAPRDYN